MSENSYKYLFPYEKIPIHSRILIYGAGMLGQEYLRQIQMTGYCEVVAVADKNYREYPPMVVPVVAPERIHELSFDYAVAALRGEAAWNEVKRVLMREGVAEERIVCIFERKEADSVFLESPASLDSDADGLGCPKDAGAERLACSKSRMSVALLVTGGLGDMVIQKRFVMEIMRLAPECAIDFYSVKNADFLKHLYSDCGNVNLTLPDLGSRYRENHKRYALALTIEACHFIKVDRWERETFIAEKDRSFQKFVWRIDRLKEETDKEDAGISTPMHLTMARRLYMGLNAYSGFNYSGAFSIADKNVQVPLDSDWEREFEKLGLGKYITFNFGNGDCADGSRIAKSWSREGFERVTALFKGRYPHIGAVQLGDKNAEKLAGIDRYVLGADLRLAVHILKSSLLHIDIEGGLVHIATQLGTKCAVLFGPTVEEYYGYAQNINIRAGGCHNCWGLYPDMNRCARGMDRPECMSSITPEIVMERIGEYMESVL